MKSSNLGANCNYYVKSIIVHKKCLLMRPKIDKLYEQLPLLKPYYIYGFHPQEQNNDRNGKKSPQMLHNIMIT